MSQDPKRSKHENKFYKVIEFAWDIVEFLVDYLIPSWASIFTNTAGLFFLNSSLLSSLDCYLDLISFKI